MIFDQWLSGHAPLARGRKLFLSRSFQLPFEALQRGRSLVGPDRCRTLIAVAGMHQDRDVLEFFLYQG